MLTPAPARLKFGLLVLAVTVASRVAADVVVDAAVLEAVMSGSARVIVELRLTTEFTPEGGLSGTDVQLQREAIATAQRAVVTALAASDARVVREYATVPYVALEIGALALAELRRMPQHVVRIRADDMAAPTPPSHQVGEHP